MFLTTTLEFGGGTEKQVSLFAQETKYPCIVVSIMTPKDKQHADNLIRKGIRVYFLGINHWWRFPLAYDIFRIIKKENVRVINAYLFHAFMLARFVKIFTGVKVISNHRCIERSWHRNLIDRCTKFLTDREIGNSQAVVDHVVERTY